MLRRKILTSAMASVMAIGSVAVVASADDTTAVATTHAKTKADLEAYVKSFDGFLSDDINDYGSISGEKFLDAIEYAENVLEDDGSTVDDFTVAFAMVEATYNRLKIYTAEELKALLDANKKIFEQGNVYNEELGDPVFEETGYASFEDAYVDAESVLGSSDSRIITDAYEVLDGAVKSLSRYDVVTKAQFRTALKEYESMLQKEFKYESWRVGTMSSDWFDLKTVSGDEPATGYWGYQGQDIAYGALYAHLKAANEEINAAYEQMDEIQGLKQTSLTDIVRGYYSAVNAVTVMNAWSPDDTNRASKASVQKILNEYHSRLVYDYATTDANELFDSVLNLLKSGATTNLKVLITINDEQATQWLDLTKAEDIADFKKYYKANGGWNTVTAPYTADPDLDGSGISYTKLIEAGINIKAGSQFYIPLDDEGKYWRKDANGNFEKLSTTKPNGKYKLITKNVDVDLTDYIEVKASMLNQKGKDYVVSSTDNASTNNVNDGDVVYYQDETDKKWKWKHDERIGRWGTVQHTKQVTYGPTDWWSDVIVDADKFIRTDLYTAMKLAETYLTNEKADIEASDIYWIDTTDSIAEGTAKGSSTEWTLVYRYLKYALHDKYDASFDLYTKADVEKLIEDSYELAEKTGDAALFSVSHNRLVEARQAALDWVKLANKDKRYKDNISAPLFVEDQTYVFDDGKPVSFANNSTATDVYKVLKGYYNALNSDYKAFMYSFDEVYFKISDVKAAIDEGDLEGTDTLLAALEDLSYKLSVVKSFEEEFEGLENDAFTSDRYFQGFNRVYTKGHDQDHSLPYKTTTGAVAIYNKDEGYIVRTLGEKEKKEDVTLKSNEVFVSKVETAKKKIIKPDDNAVSKTYDSVYEAYKTLLAEVEKQTNPEVKLGDVNKDGVVNALDAAEILKAAVNNTVIDVKVGDYNADGTVNALDASAILKFVVGLA